MSDGLIDTYDRIPYTFATATLELASERKEVAASLLQLSLETCEPPPPIADLLTLAIHHKHTAVYNAIIHSLITRNEWSTITQCRTDMHTYNVRKDDTTIALLLQAIEKQVAAIISTAGDQPIESLADEQLQQLDALVADANALWQAALTDAIQSYNAAAMQSASSSASTAEALSHTAATEGATSTAKAADADAVTEGADVASTTVGTDASSATASATLPPRPLLSPQVTAAMLRVFATHADVTRMQSIINDAFELQSQHTAAVINPTIIPLPLYVDPSCVALLFTQFPRSGDPSQHLSAVRELQQRLKSAADHMQQRLTLSSASMNESTKNDAAAASTPTPTPTARPRS